MLLCNLESCKYLHEINLQQASRPLGLIWESWFPSNLCKFPVYAFNHAIRVSSPFHCHCDVLHLFNIPFYILKVWSRNRHIWLCSSIEFKYSSESKYVYNFIRTIITFQLKFILLFFIAIFVLNVVGKFKAIHLIYDLNLHVNIFSLFNRRILANFQNIHPTIIIN